MRSSWTLTQMGRILSSEKITEILPIMFASWLWIESVVSDTHYRRWQIQKEKMEKVLEK
jgi:hypothetical protein